MRFCHSTNLAKQSELGYVFWFTDGNGWKYNDFKVSSEAEKKNLNQKNKIKNNQIYDNIKICRLLRNLWKERKRWSETGERMKQGLKVILSFSLPVHLSVLRCANTLVPSGMSSWRKRREREFKPIRNHAVHEMV